MTTMDVPPLPALARASLDRAADERADEGLLERLRADPAARVLAVHGDRAPLADGGLRYVSAAEVTGDVEWAFLGRDDQGRAVLAAVAADRAPAPVDAEAWGALRAVGGTLSAEDAGAFVEALSLGRWLLDAPFCPACGTRTEVRQAGWSRHCGGCGREHFPRTDPAVIVAVASADDRRLLLGKNALWAQRQMFSTFAGFVEAGESLESAIVREIAEEAGAIVDRLAYRGSQSWPYPRSIMLGFHAAALPASEARADGVEIVEVRWFTRAEITAALAGEADFTLPGTASIAHRLIADWAAR